MPDEPGLAREAFESIYSRGGWGGLGSGPGSLPYNARPYATYVADTLRRKAVRAVVDIGCGDWQMWPAGAFDGVDRYIGFDIVTAVVEKNRAMNRSPKCEFHVGDATRMPLPPGDLLLCKEVLQHLPNADVYAFLDRATRCYPIVVLCDDIWMGENSRWRRSAKRLRGLPIASWVTVNKDIEPGDYRPLDLALPPFSDLPLGKRLVYRSSSSARCRTMKAIWSSETAGSRA